MGAIGCAVVIAAAGLWTSRGLQIGDLDPGATELRKDSRYNQDNAYITKNYALSSDLFAVIVKTPKDACLNYKTLVQADRLGWRLQQDPSVQTTVSLADAVRNITAGSFEGNPKWLTINRNQDVINYSGQQATFNRTFNRCSVLPVIAYWPTTGRFAQARGWHRRGLTRNDKDVTFKLAAGSAGIERNEVVSRASRSMLLYLRRGGAALRRLRSWRAAIVAVLPQS